MCARFSLFSGRARLARLFQVPELPEFEPRYNIAPSLDVLAILAGAAGREAHLMRWGLVPFWAEDRKVGLSLINARGETVAEKPAFRRSFEKRRCLIPADGFFEWETVGGKKQPHFFRASDDSILALAGLWERWHGVEPPLESCTIVTTTANGVVERLHDRMPVIVPEAHFDEWLDPQTDAATLRRLIAPCDDDDLIEYPVTPRMGNTRYEAPDAVEPLGTQGSLF